MKKIESYLSIDEAVQSLDSRGEFILTKAENGVISKLELGKVGGDFNDNQQMILFLEMLILKLNDTDKKTVISKLDEELNRIYKKYKPQHLLISEANLNGIISSNVIIKGIPKVIPPKSDFKGFTKFPIYNDNLTTTMIIPLLYEYDVYELKDGEFSEIVTIASLKDSGMLPEKKITVGGVLKEFTRDEKEIKATAKFLEIGYYSES